MEHASSFVEIDELDPVEIPGRLERRIGMAAAIAIGAFGVAMLVTLYVARDQLVVMLQMGGWFIDLFLFQR